MMRNPGEVLATLENIIAERRRSGDDNSYTARLLEAGPARIAKKLGEEGVETALAGAAGSREELISEAADLLYHLLVLLASRDCTSADVAEELARRFGVSGVSEKASRETS